MSKMNVARVILGGLSAGLVINIGEFLLNGPVLGSQYEDTLQQLDLQPPGGAALAALVVLGFVVGVAAVWLYAAVRPRLGAGATTALVVGFVVWLLFYGSSTVTTMAMGLFPVGIVLIAAAWGLAELLIATLAGAFVYREA